MYGNQQGYFQAWNQGNRRPIVTVRYSDPDELFDAYAYPRGGAVLSMLRFVLGEESFWKAINHYVKKNQWQNVETSDLNAAIEEATGQNLSWFFDEWVYRMGHPEFEITSSYDGSKSLKLTVKQTQKPDDKRPWFRSPDFFTMPVDIAVTTGSGEKIHRVWIDKPEKEFTFEVDSKPLIVNFDRGNYIIKQVKFNRSDDELAYQLLHDSDTMGRVLAAIALKGHPGDAVTKAAAEAVKSMPADFRVSITNAPGAGVYPISSFTWMLFYENPKDKAQAKVMVDFMKWALTDGQKYCSELGYAPLPEPVVKMEMAALAKIKVS